MANVENQQSSEEAGQEIGDITSTPQGCEPQLFNSTAAKAPSSDSNGISRPGARLPSPSAAQATQQPSPPTDDAPRVDHARFLVRCGYKLARIRPRSKTPADARWNTNPISTEAAAYTAFQDRPNDNIGVVLDRSGLASLDVDSPGAARIALAALGTDLDALLGDRLIPRIEGDPTKARLLFKAPENTILPTRKLRIPEGPNKGMIFELRCEGAQDVFPPSMHPSGVPYRWIRSPWEPNFRLPEPSPALLDLWTNWDKYYAPMMEAIDPHGFQQQLESAAVEYHHRTRRDDAWDEVRQQICERITPAEYLSGQGIHPVRPNVYLCPFHEERRPSFWLYGDFWICAHGNAPVGFVSRKGHSIGDVIDLYQYYEHIDGPGKATSLLSRQLGICARSASHSGPPPAPSNTFGSFGSENPTTKHENQWPDPLPVATSTFTAAPFHYTLLPDTLCPWIEDISERMQCPADYPAVGALVLLAGLLGRQVAIRPKEFDDWQVVPNLWGAIVGPPSQLKSPALIETLRPLAPLEKTAREEYKQAKVEFEAQKMIADIEEDLLSRTLKEQVKNNQNAFSTARDFLDQAEEPPTERRYRTNDTTIEKLGVLLNQNPNGVLVMRDELQGFFRTLDKPGHEADRAFFLEGWSGNSSFTFDRIKRGTIHIDAVCISILGSIQPGPLAAYINDARKQGVADDGLIQRFQVLVWPEISTKWTKVDRAPDFQSREAVMEAFRRLDRLSPTDIGAELPHDGDDLPYLRFSAEAQELFDHWHQTLELRLRGGALEPVMEAHLAKYRSLAPSIALLLHLLDGERGPVGLKSMGRAASWCEYLESHALKMYSYRPDTAVSCAQALARRLDGNDLSTPFTARDLKRKQWSGLTDAGAVSDALDLLEELGWLKSKQLATGGRPQTLYDINPRIFSEKKG